MLPVDYSVAMQELETTGDFCSIKPGNTTMNTNVEYQYVFV